MFNTYLDLEEIMTERSERKPRPKPAASGNERRSGSGENRPEWQQRVSRPRRDDEEKSPLIPDQITENDLDMSVRVQLKTLTQENAEMTARHLAMVNLLFESDPQLAHKHAKAAAKSSDPEHYRKQGTLLMAAEDYKGAIKALENALDRGIDKPAKVHFSLMEANFYAGNFKAAYKHVVEAKKDRSMRRNASAWEPYIKEKAKNRGISI